MKKPLHKKSETFLSYADGRITVWDEDDEEVLVEAANRGLGHSIDELTRVDGLMVFERTVAQWLTGLRKDGFTALMIEELNKQTADIRYRRLLNLDEDGSPRWDSIADLGGDIGSESKAAYAISHLLGSGAFQRLRQCQEDTCDRFFLGPPNARWCSDRCGSRSRGRDKRKRDSESGALPGT
jgi:hypothetical protein